MRNRPGESSRAEANVHQAHYTSSLSLTALYWAHPAARKCVVTPPWVCVRVSGNGISVFTQVDLFCFSLVIVKNKVKSPVSFWELVEKSLCWWLLNLRRVLNPARNHLSTTLSFPGCIQGLTVAPRCYEQAGGHCWAVRKISQNT